MKGRNSRRAGALCAVALVAAAFGAAPASAASTGNFACTSTALRLFTSNYTSVGNNASCADLSSPITNLGPVALQLGGTTKYEPNFNGANAASAEASLASVNIKIAGLQIGASVLRARATTRCVPNGSTALVPASTSQSLVEVIYINGRPVARGDRPDKPFVLNLSPLVRLYANRQIPTPNGVIQRALEVELLGQSVLVAGEAATGARNAAACAPTPAP